MRLPSGFLYLDLFGKNSIYNFEQATELDSEQDTVYTARNTLRLFGVFWWFASFGSPERLLWIPTSWRIMMIMF